MLHIMRIHLRGPADGGTVRLEGFLYEDIYAEGLTERVCDANLDGEAYHAARE